MHTTPGSSEGIYFHHNGDFSGDLVINIKELPEDHFRHQEATAEKFTSQDGTVTWSVVVPFEDIKHIVAEAIRSEEIERLENASTDFLLRRRLYT